MDEQLAAIYGNEQEVEQDIEKVVAAELLVKLAEEQGVDLDQFSDEEVGEMLGDLYANGMEHTAGVEVPAEVSQEKCAEADYLGRIMAHSMTQELREIEKEAASAKKVWQGIKSIPKKIKRTGEVLSGSKLKQLEGAGYSPTRGAQGMIGKERKAVERARGIAKKIGKGAGGAALVGGSAYAGGKMAKEGSAIDALADQRAFELAKEAGYVDDSGQFFDSQVKEASALDLAVERRALEICEANGIPVEWNE